MAAHGALRCNPGQSRRTNYLCIPAKSKKQQMAAGAALAAKHGKRSSRGIVRQTNTGRAERFYSPVLSPCIVAIASLKGVKLTRLAPVKGWSRT